MHQFVDTQDSVGRITNMSLLEFIAEHFDGSPYLEMDAQEQHRGDSVRIMLARLIAKLNDLEVLKLSDIADLTEDRYPRLVYAEVKKALDADVAQDIQKLRKLHAAMLAEVARIDATLAADAKGLTNIPRELEDSLGAQQYLLVSLLRKAGLLDKQENESSGQ